MRKKFILSIFFIIICEFLFYKFWTIGLWSLSVFIPYIVIGIYDISQKNHLEIYSNKIGS